jgi:hypothetical protein
MRGISPSGMPQRTAATLFHDGAIMFKGNFIECSDIDDPHVLEVDGFVVAESIDEEQCFFDFILENRKRIEKEIWEDMRIKAELKNIGEEE